MKPLSDKELAIFCQQAAMMIKSGMLIHNGIQMIADDTKETPRKQLFATIADKLSDNVSLAQALQETKVFPEHMINMVEIGTKSGQLDVVMSSLSAYYDRQHEMKETVKGAVAYPTVLIIMMLAVLVFLSVKVLPVFQQVFNNLGAHMSPWAISMMSFGAWINSYYWIFIIIMAVLLILYIIFSKKQKDNSAFSHFIAGKKARENFSLVTFTSSLSMMMSSGLDTMQSLQMSAQAVQDQFIREKIVTAIHNQDQKDFSLIKTLAEIGLFSHSAMGILAMGSHTGSIDSAAQYVANLYEEEYQSALSQKVALIEPVSITIISVLVGSVLISVMFPLLGILSTMG